MHFYSGLLMYFCSGVDKFATDTTAEWIAGQVTEAFPWDGTPRHLIRDRDGAFGPAYALRIRAMGIRDHPVAARSSWQNGHVERLIGSIRRESLDNLMVSGEAQLRRILKSYAAYSNEVGPLLSLGKDAPNFRRCEYSRRPRRDANLGRAASSIRSGLSSDEPRHEAQSQTSGPNVRHGPATIIACVTQVSSTTNSPSPTNRLSLEASNSSTRCRCPHLMSRPLRV